MLQRLTVKPTQTLSEVATKMVSNALAGDCACHHVLAQEDDGRFLGVISSQDLVCALCSPEMWESHPCYPDMFAPPDAAEATTSMTILDVMKHRDSVFTCPPSDTFKDVLKVLLLTRQNSVIIMDDQGVHGIITPRDAVRAFASRFDSNALVSVWLEKQPTGITLRLIESDARLLDAAQIMTAQSFDHLVVVLRGTMEAVGILSSLDILLCTKARTPLLRSVPLWLGPSVGEVLSQHAHLSSSSMCPAGTSLGEVAELLLTTGRTSAMIELSGKTPMLGLLTENDIVRAYDDGWPRNSAFEGWLTATEFQRPSVPPHLLVPPGMPLTDAASLMLSAAEPGRPCHHLVVKAATGGWLGVFSSLDVARALQSLSSELDKARVGADQTTVDVVMKPVATVPTCRAGATIRDALCELDIFGQNAVLVADGNGKSHLITPRCALQALAEGVPQDRSVAAWIQSRRVSDGAPREILLGSKLSEAAAIMVAHCLHHLLVMEASGGGPAGVLSSLDVVRGIASINYCCPFASLGWLRTLKDRHFSLHAPHEAGKAEKKKPGAPVDARLETAPHKLRRE
ncbi:unnamed protein product [Polarella glacialis]|uniref:CBS domain-containing protein n=1 Tax=Polarella glacialis TaxID=89957 RepID=A0A813HTC2_POLGL|nr:unnamed protein product [Polarella glacialis]